MPASDTLPDIHFGEVTEDVPSELPDVDDSGDDDEDEPADADLIALLGFDPDDEPEEHGLVVKSEVGYEHPAKGDDHCGECFFFVAPDACQLVAPPIMPQDWCQLHEDKDAFEPE